MISIKVRPSILSIPLILLSSCIGSPIVNQAVVTGIPTAPLSPTATSEVTPVPSPTPVRSDHLSLPAIEDTFISSTSPDQNYGDLDTLEADNAPAEKRALFRFNLDSIPSEATVLSATLTLAVFEESESGGSIFKVDGDWDEHTVTWSNAPAVGSRIVLLSDSLEEGSRIGADVTRAVAESDGFVEFYLMTSSSDGVDYYSRQSPHPPQLEVSWALEPFDPTDAVIEPSGPADAVLVGAADVAMCSRDDDEATADLLDEIDGTVFVAGDTAYPDGSPEDFSECYDPSWGRHRERTRPALGNHEYGTPGASGYFEYFGDLAGEPGAGYYSYDLEEWHIIVLNTNCSDVGGCDAGSPQEQWLRNDLSSHPTTCALAYFHHPLYSSGATHGGSKQVRDIWIALYEYGVDVVLNGHEHLYERFAPQNPYGVADPIAGIRQFIVGTGGSNLHELEETLAENSEVADDTTHGVLKLDLYPSSYAWQFVPVQGDTFTDAGHSACY